jgi:glycosyltransferase involved in cell wall biosynthesis
LKISLLVPAFNEEKLLAETLRSIQQASAAFTARGWETELIVCDNNSTDRTAEIAREAGATVVLEPINQIARARNRAASAASGDWLVFVDADSQPSPGLFEDAAKAMLDSRVMFGGVTIRLAGFHPIAATVTGFWNLVSRIGKYVAGSFIFCEAAAFRKVGGFDHQFFAGEELDLSNRLSRLARQTGKRCVILHRHPLLTSDRKVRLYSTRELLGFMVRAGLSRHKILRNKEACHPWYDGRR